MRRQGPLRYCLAAFRADSTKLARQKNIDTIYSSACPEFITYWITFRSEGRVYHKLSARQRRGLGLAGSVTLCIRVVSFSSSLLRILVLLFTLLILSLLLCCFPLLNASLYLKRFIKRVAPRAYVKSSKIKI